MVPNVYTTSKITVWITIARESIFSNILITTISQRNTKKHVGFKSLRNKLNGGLTLARATRVHSLRRRRSLTCPILLSNQNRPSISNGTRGTRVLLITMVRVSVNETRIVYLWSHVYPFLSLALESRVCHSTRATTLEITRELIILAHFAGGELHSEDLALRGREVVTF